MCFYNNHLSSLFCVLVLYVPDANSSSAETLIPAFFSASCSLTTSVPLPSHPSTATSHSKTKNPIAKANHTYTWTIAPMKQSENMLKPPERRSLVLSNSERWRFAPPLTIQIFGDLRIVNRSIHQGTLRSGMNLALFLRLGKTCANKNLRERRETGRCSHSSTIP